MPTREHEIWLELIQERPSLAADLLRLVHPEVPDFEEARVESGALNDYKPTEYRADSVVSLLSGNNPALALIVEVQRGPVKEKRWSWPAYLGTLWSRRRCPVALLVICPDRGVARQARVPIQMGHPGLVITPLVLGPDEMPTIIDPDEATRNVELAVLSALVHGTEPEAEKVFAGMFDVFHRAGLDGTAEAQAYIDELLAMLPQAAGKLLEAIMQTKQHEYKSDYFRRAKAEAEAEGLAKAVLTVLDSRGVEVTDEVRARIVGCTDLEQLGVWLRRAVSAASAGDLFD
ncbi:hypothetical protein SAMN04489712_12456 [Thermomonospora echinospora]|uniref:Uncharacterized protein n=1 Tax=Thermomonospora echinospora TaxID=1992 RepID=A0A1H6DXG0_9ACTN|nr:hypothetical protein [Thermomonospora echinospora]SEG89764.1 hypothetical protein SAMN04489712_12456 [Thermomonospora echinospora]